MDSTKNRQMPWPVIEVSERAAGQVRRGSLWIFSNEFETKLKGLEKGTWVDFRTKKNYVGFGYVNPHSLIAGRLISREPVDDRRAAIKTRISHALQKRAHVVGCGSFRAVFSESDDLPGLIVDVYGEPHGRTVIAQLTTAGMDTAIDDVRHGLEELLNPEGLVLRGDSSIRHLEGIDNFKLVARGDEDKLHEGHVREDDVLFSADFINGQKTGFFLDQRENRRHLKDEARGKTVLDLCCYSGGWGLSALKGGAKHVTFVDQSEQALALVKQGLALNRFSESHATLVIADVFEFLERDKSAYDIVIADPPAFVKSKKNLPQAIQAYKKLNQLAMRRLNPRGVLYSCSCSFHLNETDFENVLVESLAKQAKVGRVVYRGGQASDHPWILNRPESHYLKCLALEIE